MPKKKLSAAEKELRRLQNRHKAVVRSTFANCGFVRVDAFADAEFTFEGTTSDFDDLFIWKNVFLFSEYTVKKNGHSEHLKKKEFLYKKIRGNPEGFLKQISEKHPEVKAAWDQKFDAGKVQIRFIYCTTTDPDDALKAQVPDVLFYDMPVSMYFKALSSTIKHSARPEVLSYLGIPFAEAGDNCLQIGGVPSQPFNGSLLPDSHSHLGDQFKVVSLYVSPAALLDRAYVLRREGWRDSEWLYQRMIGPKKIEAIRSFLRQKKRVFLNNIIVTLPPSTKILDEQGDTVDSAKIKKTQPVIVQLPQESNSVGLIDGQHRVFSYHVGGRNDDEIAPLRDKLNLLVTGIMYPNGMGDDERMKFEAELFLEINSNQASAKSDLKQAITSILNPYDAVAIAKRVLVRLNRSGALLNCFMSYFYDTERLKTTSVVSYGLRHVVSLLGAQSLITRYDVAKRDTVLKKQNLAALEEYVGYCFIELNRWFLAAKQALPGDRWTYDRSVADRFLNTTNVNGLIQFFRLFIEAGRPLTDDERALAMVALKEIDLQKYKSSQYGQMGRDLFQKYKDAAGF